MEGERRFFEARLQVFVIVLVGICVLLQAKSNLTMPECVRMDGDKVARCMDDEMFAGMFYLCGNEL